MKFAPKKIKKTLDFCFLNHYIYKKKQTKKYVN